MNKLSEIKKLATAHHYRAYVVMLFLISFLPIWCKAQSTISADSLRNSLLKIKALSDADNDHRPIEKLFLQFDKPYYTLGDTIWFKAYLFNQAYLSSGKSGLIYIDIANDTGKVVKQCRWPVREGLSWGNIILDTADFKAGSYTLHAYTNWMRNFGNDYFFSKSFYITGTDDGGWLVNKQEYFSAKGAADTARVKLQLSDMNKIPATNNTLKLRVMSGNKTLYKQQVLTDRDGMLDVNFKLPQKPGKLALVARDDKNNKKAVIPLDFNGPEDADVQFLPEGGNLVAGLPAHVGFKAIGGDGRGIGVQGIVVGQNQQQVCSFKSQHNGIGSFDMDVKAGETYSARVTLPGGAVKTFQLPAIKNSGTVLKIINRQESDSLDVNIEATADIVASTNSFFLVGKARGVVCYAAILNFREGGLVKRKVAKSFFPPGITHFTLMAGNGQPLNERLVFTGHPDNFNIFISGDKSVYAAGDSVALKISVTNKAGDAVAGNFSLAVTDDALVKADTSGDDNIIAHLLLASELKGYVEGAGYYLSSKTDVAWQALDNLLLTQGWVGYDWHYIINPVTTPVYYQAEDEFKARGTVLNVFSKPVKGTHVLLFSKKPNMLLDTTTDSEGKFVFDHLPPVDTPAFVLKAVNKNGKSFNVRVIMDDAPPPVFFKSAGPAIAPWYLNSDPTLLNYTRHNPIEQQMEAYKGSGQLLKEVKIAAKKIIKGSQNMNGPGNADIVLDEKDLEKAGNKTWLQVFREQIKGFGVKDVGGKWDFIQDLTPPLPKIPGALVSSTHKWFVINQISVKFYVDGISITQVDPTSLSEVFGYSAAYTNVLNYLNSTSAEDIKGIEVSYTDGYALAYFTRYGLAYSPPPTFWDAAFIEITTRSGNGPIMANTPGMYLYKPLPVSWPKQFYKPKYEAKDTVHKFAPLRPTIDWEPNIFTGTLGTAKVSFYSADKSSTYTLIIQGTDMNGNFGYGISKINIGPRTGTSEAGKTQGK